MPEHILHLHDLKFRVEQAVIRGWLYDDAGGEPHWYIEVRGEGQRFGDDTFSRVLSPRFYWESLPLSIDDWRDLDGRVFIQPPDIECEDEDGPTLYLCAHLPLPDWELRLSGRKGGQFDLFWRGHADANWDERYGNGMLFEMAFPIVFEHQEVRFWLHDDTQDIEQEARAVMQRRGLSGDALGFSHYQRFRDDPQDPHFRLIRAFFLPV